MSVQLNREQPQGKPGLIKPTECFTIKIVSLGLNSLESLIHICCKDILLKTKKETHPSSLSVYTWVGELFDNALTKRSNALLLLINIKKNNLI